MNSKISLKFVSEVSVLIALIVLNVLIGEHVHPYHRGFFCNDQSIRYPMKPSTVGSVALLFISLFIPAGLIFVFENNQTWKPWTLQFWKVLYNSTYGFFIGFLITFLMTSACKYSIGRLRPNFMSACQPVDYYNQTACEDMTNVYITNYTCTAATGYLAVDIHESFFSGHSSLSFHAMVYLSLVIQRRIPGRKWALPRLLFQSFAIILASLVAYSRVSDYWHHWQDVTIGIIVGTLIAIATEYAFREGKDEKQKKEFSENINCDVESTYERST